MSRPRSRKRLCRSLSSGSVEGVKTLADAIYGEKVEEKTKDEMAAEESFTAETKRVLS